MTTFVSKLVASSTNVAGMTVNVNTAFASRRHALLSAAESAVEALGKSSSIFCSNFDFAVSMRSLSLAPMMRLFINSTAFASLFYNIVFVSSATSEGAIDPVAKCTGSPWLFVKGSIIDFIALVTSCSLGLSSSCYLSFLSLLLIIHI